MKSTEKFGSRMCRMLSIILFVLCVCTVFAETRSQLVDRIVAVVDDEVILWSELNLRVELELRQSGRNFRLSEEELDKLRQQALDAMIDEQVLILKAKKDSIQIEGSRVEEILNERFNQVKNSEGEQDYRDMLERVGLTERQLKARSRKDIRHGLLFEQMRQVIAYRLHITHKDVETFRQAHSDTLPAMVFLSQINIKVKPDSAVLGEVRKKIQVVQQKLEAGEVFADLARTYSEDPATVADGGDLGCFEAGMLMPEFESEAFRLKTGEISQPVLTKHGYHLIQLHEKREDELCASHILIRAPSSQQDKERIRSQLEELRQRALAGGDFAELARAYSEDPSARSGGLWNQFPKDQIPLFLQPYLNHLKLGGISEPFFLEDDGHIIKINDDHATLEGLIREMRLAESMRQLIADYKEEIHVDRRTDESGTH